MTIVNDVVTFQASDFVALSSLAVAALQAQPGSLAAQLAQLSIQITTHIKQAKTAYVNTNAGNNADLGVLIQKFANANAQTLANAADEIAALSAALGPL